ncbi:MAG: riboflavin biosynthesis protein RibF [Kiritimatiellaeota bacterium]|nr:riboflavin biosynthesis protein RibF [Kiritimatiellota bacterium]
MPPFPAVLTFDPHPLAVLAPERAPRLITPLAERLRLLAESRVEACLLLPFTRELAALTPDDFVAQILSAWLTPNHSITIAAGANWRFGRGGAGDLQSAVAASRGKIKALPVASVALPDGEAVSSSAIRRLIAAGDLERAVAMLGRCHEIRGVAVHGRGVGTQIGFATANLRPAEDVILPPCGVYAVDAKPQGADAYLPAVANLGFRPTFGDARPAAPELEVHILGGFGGDLHGAEIAVRFAAKIRDEKKFTSPHELSEQIKADIIAAKTILKYNEND